MITFTILLNCIFNTIATSNFYFSVSDYVCTLMSSVIIIHANSPRYDSNLPVSRMGHQISRIKTSDELFCALIWSVSQIRICFESKVAFWGIFVRISSLTKIFSPFYTIIN